MKKFALSTLAIVLLSSSYLFADSSPDTSQFGFGIEGFKINNSGYGGIAIGYRSLNYVGHSDFNYGYQLWAGSSNGVTGITNHNHLYYGGLNLGRAGLLSKNITYELNVLGGYADGNIAASNLSGDSLAIEPSIGVGMLLGYGWRGAITLGYIYTPNANGFSGMTIGLRLDRKTIDTVIGAQTNSLNQSCGQ